MSVQIADQHYDNVPGIAELRQTISSACDAATARRKLPDNLTLNITTFGGNAQGVTKALGDQQVKPRSQDVD